MDDEYDLVPLHHRPELVDQCCRLLNAEWPRSKTARLKSLNVSCDEFPTCLVLIHKGKNRIVGHCKISLIPWKSHSCFIESVVIEYRRRSQGLGSRLLKGAEEYAASRGIKNVYLITKGQEIFYFKNGYDIIDPVKLYGVTNIIAPPALSNRKTKDKNTQCAGPPPPPMPTLQIPAVFDVRMLSRKTHLVKTLG